MAARNRDASRGRGEPAATGLRETTRKGDGAPYVAYRRHVDERSHLRASLVITAVFLSLGLWLEAMFGLRADGGLDVPFRREFLRLGHAHGAILGVLNLTLAFAVTRLSTPEAWARRSRLACAVGAGLVGGGFVGGGVWPQPDGPGELVYAVPVGAMAVLAALVVVAVTRPGD